jgi:hypothetical protein
MMLVLILLATWVATWIGVTLFLRRKGSSAMLALSGGFVVSCVVLALVSTILTEQTKEAPKAQLAAQKPERQRLQKKAQDDGRKGMARQYSDTWPSTVASGEPECIDMAMIMNTPSGTYLLNSTGMDRHGNTYKSSRDVGMPVPGLENDPQAKLPPPQELMQYGLKLCD